MQNLSLMIEPLSASSPGWRFRRLARDYERLPDILKYLHLLAFTPLLFRQFANAMAQYA